MRKQLVFSYPRQEDVGARVAAGDGGVTEQVGRLELDKSENDAGDDNHEGDERLGPQELRDPWPHPCARFTEGYVRRAVGVDDALLVGWPVFALPVLGLPVLNLLVQGCLLAGTSYRAGALVMRRHTLFEPGRAVVDARRGQLGPFRCGRARLLAGVRHY